jgi:hypothetical protein
MNTVTRLLSWATLLGAAALLSACASAPSVHTDVASFGAWPAGRAPGTYAFDRLPSQAARADVSAQLEATAAPALERAGFKPAPAGSAPDVLVQVAARTDRTVSPWADPLWWRGGAWPAWPAWPAVRVTASGVLVPVLPSVWVHPGWAGHAGWGSSRFGHEVAVLLRDRTSGQPLWEARVLSDSFSRGDAALFTALFNAALHPFPMATEGYQRVTVPVPVAKP